MLHASFPFYKTRVVIFDMKIRYNPNVTMMVCVVIYCIRTLKWCVVMRMHMKDHVLLCRNVFIMCGNM